MSECETSAIKKVILRAAGSLLVALVVQSFALTWWASNISARMTHVERGLDTVTQRVHAMEIDR